MDALTEYLEQNRDRFVDDLKAVLRIPSVSAQPQHRDDVRRCAVHIANHLESIGMTHVEVVSTEGHPIVYAEWLEAPGKPTALLYGHYDVQPPEPLELWKYAAVRADAARRQALRARRGRRQGPGLHASEGDRGAHAREREAADQPEAGDRGRGGSREREPRGVPARATLASSTRDVIVVSDTAMLGAGSAGADLQRCAASSTRRSR